MVSIARARFNSSQALLSGLGMKASKIFFIQFVIGAMVSVLILNLSNACVLALFESWIVLLLLLVN